MNEPVHVGEVIGEKKGELVRIPKKCPTCGREYEGYSVIGLRPGEERAIYPCDDCMQKAEDEQRARERAQRAECHQENEDLELQRPERTRRDVDE